MKDITAPKICAGARRGQPRVEFEKLLRELP